MPSANPPAEALGDVPKTYADVPVLGRPLPGDLGRPILRHRRAVEPAGAGEAAREARQRLEADQATAAAERKAARESGVMMPSFRAETRGADVSNIPRADLPVMAARDDVGDQPGESDVADSARIAGEVKPHVLMPPVSPHVLAAGSIIAASLITGLNSDLPGFVAAQVTENVYDSPTGRTLLIPQGARLVGSYESDVAFGQRRALIVWQRIILPDGSSLRIDDMPASDTRGYSGLEGEVDRHDRQLVKGILLSTLLGVGAELGVSGEGELVRAVREATQRDVARAGDQIVANSLNVKPTITVRPGWPLRIVVNRDLVLAPWRG